MIMDVTFIDIQIEESLDSIICIVTLNHVPYILIACTHFIPTRNLYNVPCPLCSQSGRGIVLISYPISPLSVSNQGVHFGAIEKLPHTRSTRSSSHDRLCPFLFTRLFKIHKLTWRERVIEGES